ncbi:hypothetical protein NDU88_004504 [Pleurodeles waltl]|uniref:Uncharacterized protein n=1 Tax=Pleurodeles waltl TaxID=8319 RepID=A0AAV7ME80_PLEWA|nr:hypothetical protein NDU88_004504 [Pleurodeles waltl]
MAPSQPVNKRRVVMARSMKTGITEDSSQELDKCRNREVEKRGQALPRMWEQLNARSLTWLPKHMRLSEHVHGQPCVVAVTRLQVSV